MLPQKLHQMDDAATQDSCTGPEPVIMDPVTPNRTVTTAAQTMRLTLFEVSRHMNLSYLCSWSAEETLESKDLLRKVQLFHSNVSGSQR